MKTAKSWILSISLLSATVTAQTYEVYLPRADSELYQKATECKAIDLNTWHHPTRDVMEEFNFTILKVELCNDKKYPVFIGQSEYALDTQPNQKYATEFYNALLTANGNWPYALVDTDSQFISYVSPYRDNGKIVGHSLEVEYY